MLESLKEWVNIPILIHKYSKRSATGIKEYYEEIPTMCYAEGGAKTVIDVNGAETISNKQLYLDNDVDITELDDITFEGKRHFIKSIDRFYRDGVIDCSVVYL